MFILMIIIFVLGYMAIALEHPLKIDKTSSALLIGTLTWVAYLYGASDIFHQGLSPAWNHFLLANPQADTMKGIRAFIVENQIVEHLGNISEILFFLLGAMTIVEIVDQHQGFRIITDRIKTNNKVKLLWIISFLTFFMSSVLDNLTTTIVMVALLRKLVHDKETRWYFSSIVILAANAGGAWTPIGDVTTIMLWIGGQITALHIMQMVFLPSIFTILIPTIFLSFKMKGELNRPNSSIEDRIEDPSSFERKLILFMGVGALLFVPVFKTITNLPPYMGMLLGLSIIWITTEILHRNNAFQDKSHLFVARILQRVDVPTVLFFLGILSAVASLQSAGHLNLVAKWLDDVTNTNIYIIDMVIGILSSIIDNVPLVAGTMGMYDIQTVGHFAVDGVFWELLAYTAGTGGSILIIGSAAGVAAMGMEKIDFIWYMKRISLLALMGYFAGIAIYLLQAMLLHEH